MQRARVTGEATEVSRFTRATTTGSGRMGESTRGLSP